MKMYSELKFFGRENTVTLKRDQLSKSLNRGSQGSGQNNYTRTGPTFEVGGGSQRHHLSLNITNNILLALQFELTQEYLASKSQHY